MMYRDSHQQREMFLNQEYEEAKEDKKLLEFFLQNQSKKGEQPPEIDLDYENEYQDDFEDEEEGH